MNGSVLENPYGSPLRHAGGEQEVPVCGRIINSITEYYMTEDEGKGR